VCALLRDPEIEVQNRAVEVLHQGRGSGDHPPPGAGTQGRERAGAPLAVEVLNEVGDAIRSNTCWQAIKDDDWWVRSRAGDALGKIGGPKVIDAVLELVRDKDEDIRRAAIEILNQTKDERAINHLIEATRDADWWVSERAVDALAEIGNKRACRACTRCCARATPKQLPVVVRAIGKLGDAKSVDLLTAAARAPKEGRRIETIQAWRAWR
jgi:eukaryotic-like serine/threonine-protein kinase